MRWNLLVDELAADLRNGIRVVVGRQLTVQRIPFTIVG